MTPGMHSILAGGGDQTIGYTPDVTEIDALPAPTWRLEDLSEDGGSEARVLDEGPATLDTASVPLSSEIGTGLPFPRRLDVPPSSLVNGRAYILQDHLGATERVFVESAGLTSTELLTPVRGYFPAGSLVRGVHLSATVLASAADDEDLLEEQSPLLVTWEFYVQGKLRRVTELARVVRGEGASRYSADVEREIAGAWPELAAQLERDVGTFPRMVRYAERRIAARLRAHNLDPEMFMAGPQGFDMLVARTLLHFAHQGMFPASRDPETFAEERRAEYVALWQDVTTGTPGRDVIERDKDNRAEPHSRRRRMAFERA